MAEKKGKYKYKDTVKTTVIGASQEQHCGRMAMGHQMLVDEEHKNAEHHPEWNAPIDYDGDVCYIHSDLKIDGLELVEEDLVRE